MFSPNLRWQTADFGCRICKTFTFYHNCSPGRDSLSIVLASRRIWSRFRTFGIISLPLTIMSISSWFVVGPARTNSTILSSYRVNRLQEQGLQSNP